MRCGPIFLTQQYECGVPFNTVLGAEGRNIHTALWLRGGLQLYLSLAGELRKQQLCSQRGIEVAATLLKISVFSP